MSMLDEKSLIKSLYDYGHLEMPFGEKRVLSKPIKQLTLNDQEVRDAIESFQDYHSGPIEPLIAKYYPERTSAAVRVNGELGPATLELLQTARCAVPDYDMSLADEIVGAGNWKRCHGIGEYHKAVVRFTKAGDQSPRRNGPKPTGIPAFLQSHWDEIWERVVDAYAEIGLLFERDDNATNPNIDVSFVQPDSGWIGLAIVGERQGCDDRIWAEFDKNYKPSNLVVEWTTLLKHEFGHNCGFSHSKGGVMNPYIIGGLPVSWKNDPIYNMLKTNFGGKPIPRQPKSRKMVLAWQELDGNGNPTGKYDAIQEVPSSGGNIWPK